MRAIRAKPPESLGVNVRSLLEKVMAMKKKKKKLTRPQRWALFIVGVFGNPRSMIAGKRIQWRVLGSLDAYIELHPTSLTRPYRLTTEGNALFIELFGTPCPEHGWWIVHRAHDLEYRRCEMCRAVFKRVEGHEAPPRTLACDPV